MLDWIVFVHFSVAHFLNSWYQAAKGSMCLLDRLGTASSVILHLSGSKTPFVRNKVIIESSLDSISPLENASS